MERSVRQALGRAVEVGNRRALALCYHALGAVQYLVGQWAEAASHFQQSIELSQASGAVFGEVLGMQRLALLETGLGQYDVAHERLQLALEKGRASASPMVHGHGIGRILATLAINRFEAEDLPQATEYLAQGIANQQTIGECASCDVLLYPAAVPIYLALGDLEQAEQSCRKAEEAASVFHSQAWVAVARYLRGLLASARGEWELAVGSLEGARETFESLGQRYDVARCLQALAALARRGNGAIDYLDQPALLERAQTLYAQLGVDRPAIPKLSGPMW